MINKKTIFIYENHLSVNRICWQDKGMVKAAFFDMDNTLLETQALYEEAHAALALFIQGAGPFDADDIIRHTREEEAKLYPVYGYGKELLPHAFENTLLHYVPDATAAELKVARNIANDVYARQAVPKKGAMEAVERISSVTSTYLVTVGDADVQNRRIESLPCREHFAKIYVVSKKTVDTYREILAEIGVHASDAVMIGDSLKSDIMPATEAGMKAIHVPAHNWQAREMSGAALPAGARVMNEILEAADEITGQRKAPSRAKPAAPAPK